MLNVQKYAKLVDAFENLMMANQKISDVKLGSDKWTLKEIVGHLIDSAANNHQRFVRLQIDKQITFPGYGAKEWVGISNIQALDYHFAVAFWKMYNRFLLNLIKKIEPQSMQNVWVTKDGEQFTLGFLVDDYFAHMNLHYQMFVDRKREIEKIES